MTKRIMIDAEYLEETRVVVTNENNIEDFDHETTTKKQNREWAYMYLILAICFAIAGIWKDEFIWYVFSAIMIGLAAFRLYWVSKRLRK